MTSIGITINRLGYHRWPEAPEELAYLRTRHQHNFEYTLQLQVSSQARELEFHTLRSTLDAYVVEDWGTRSCEEIAQHLLTELSGVLNPVGTIEVTVDEGDCVWATVSN